MLTSHSPAEEYQVSDSFYASFKSKKKERDWYLISGVIEQEMDWLFSQTTDIFLTNNTSVVSLQLLCTGRIIKSTEYVNFLVRSTVLPFLMVASFAYVAGWICVQVPFLLGILLSAFLHDWNISLHHAQPYDIPFPLMTAWSKLQGFKLALDTAWQVDVLEAHIWAQLAAWYHPSYPRSHTYFDA